MLDQQRNKCGLLFAGHSHDEEQSSVIIASGSLGGQHSQKRGLISSLKASPLNTAAARFKFPPHAFLLEILQQ